MTQFLIIHQWRFLGSITEEHQLKQWKNLAMKTVDYYDNNKILLSCLKSNSAKEIIDLSLLCSEETDHIHVAAHYP